MTKEEIRERLDNAMLICLNQAIEKDEANPEIARWLMGDASGIMRSASALGLLNTYEFMNICSCLCVSRIGRRKA